MSENGNNSGSTTGNNTSMESAPTPTLIPLTGTVLPPSGIKNNAKDPLETLDKTIDLNKNTTKPEENELELMLEKYWPSPIKPAGYCDKKFRRLLKMHQDIRKRYISEINTQELQKAINAFIPCYQDVQKCYSEFEKQSDMIVDALNTINAVKQKQDEMKELLMKFSIVTKSVQKLVEASSSEVVGSKRKRSE